MNQKCQNPCPGACGYNAECKVMDHIPSCLCPYDYTGDPFISCVQKQETCKFQGLILHTSIFL